jgi:hypothetical protein
MNVHSAQFLEQLYSSALADGCLANDLPLNDALDVKGPARVEDVKRLGRHWKVSCEGYRAPKPKSKVVPLLGREEDSARLQCSEAVARLGHASWGWRGRRPVWWLRNMNYVHPARDLCREPVMGTTT